MEGVVAGVPHVPHWTGREARLLRQACRLSVRTFAAQLGVAARTVSNWEAGLEQANPLPDNQAVLDTALARADQSVRDRFAFLLSQPSRDSSSGIVSAQSVGGHGGGSPGSGSDSAEEEDVRRRKLFSVLGGTFTGGVLAGVEPLRRSLVETLSIPPTAGDVASWEQLAEDYARGVGRLPTTELLPHLLVDLEDLRFDIERAPEAVRPSLIRVCAALTALVAMSFTHLDRLREAGRYWRTAQRAAQLIDDRPLQARILGKRAIFSLYENMEPSRVLRLADQAIELGDVSGHAARAQALAHWGEPRHAHQALHEVESTFLRLPPSMADDRLSQWGWSEQRLRFVQSHVYSYTGKVAEAATVQDAAFRGFPASSWEMPAQVHLHRATCMVVDGDPAGGARYAVDTMQRIPHTVRAQTLLVRRSLQALVETIPPDAHALTAVREAEEILRLPAESVL